MQTKGKQIQFASKKLKYLLNARIQETVEESNDITKYGNISSFFVWFI